MRLRACVQYWGSASSYPPRTRVRSRKNHARFMAVAVFLAMCGWLAIFVAHTGTSHFAAGKTTAKVIHVYLVGSTVLVLLRALARSHPCSHVLRAYFAHTFCYAALLPVTAAYLSV